MAGGGFGRKGLTGDQGEDSLARKREAFIAAERARRAEEGLAGGRHEMAGAATRNYRNAAPEKSLLLAYLLWFFACLVSAHRFYLGAWRSALVQLGLLFGGATLVWIAAATNTGFSGYVGAPAMIFSLLWMLADVFLIPGVHRRARSQAGLVTVFA